jgi:hypothetical protein
LYGPFNLTGSGGQPVWPNPSGTGTLDQMRKRLPASVAEVRDGADEGWQCVEIRAERLDWLPAVLAALDLPFVIERPDELRDRVVALADRLATSARNSARKPS